MKRWLKNKIGRWQAKRILTKEIRANYRIFDSNRATLENGGTL